MQNINEGRKLKAVLFDLDGTLVQTDEVHFLMFNHVLEKRGKPAMTREFYNSNICGKPNELITKSTNSFSRVTNAYFINRELVPELDKTEAEKFADEKESLFREFLISRSLSSSKTEAAESPLKVISGIDKLLRSLKDSNISLACVTNAPRANAEVILTALNFGEFFSALVIGAECEASKPHPAPYLKGLQLLGVSPANAVAFEDSSSGIQSSLSAGLKTIGVASSHEESKLIQMGVHQVIKDFSTLEVSHLESLLK
eukprot:TRINITY_DN491_c0_g1_i3.p1 TRINITY_DN491_c0_g1~~TRINITY_DN491_c0_g1_i3.p1  ORF type:complete len:291 (-),score=78.28 TRINITY_DN491_c0_g1_i3:490-1260(-)